jgi:hypothetical protein
MADVPMGVPMVVDSAHEAVSIPAERWQRWHEIAGEIGKCALAKVLCNANTMPTRRNMYWAATAARMLVQWTTGGKQVGERNRSRTGKRRRRRNEPAIGRSLQQPGPWWSRSILQAG